MQEKKERRIEEEKLRIVRNLKLMDDVMFEAFMDDGDACEELLQVVLDNPKLRIDKASLVPQKNFSIQQGRSVRVDAYVEGTEDVVFNIEIQKADNTDHLKRVRYNASCITVKRSEPGDLFEDVQELYVVYITSFDLFKDGLSTYHVEPCIKETGKFVDNGLHQVYINACCNDGSKIARLMKHFNEPDFSDNEFPKISEKVHKLKHDNEEVLDMCKTVEEYAKEYAKEYAIQACIDMMKDFTDDKDQILEQLMKQFSLTREEAESYYEKRFNLV